MTAGNSGTDLLAEATSGRLRWHDPGMSDFEKGWEDFLPGTRVEVRIAKNVWKKGVVVASFPKTERGIEVLCDDKWHTNEEFYGGRGATVRVQGNTRRGILSNLRRIDE